MIVWIFLLSMVLFSSSSFHCPYDYKVYVYDIPNHLLLNSEQARRNQTYHICRKCIWEQFSLEYILFDFFTQFCGRTSNPNEADYFYIPIIREIDYRMKMFQKGGREPSIIEKTLINAIEKNDTTLWKQNFNITDKYWHRHRGSDHIIIMAAPVTNLRHESNMRGFFHYMIQLNNPIFINVEYSRSFIKEYPFCSTKKNLVVPYPSTDPMLFSGGITSIFHNNSKMGVLRRDKLVFYQGGHHGSCEPIRSALTTIMRNNPKYASPRGEKKREIGFLTSIFCPIPIGDSPSSKRMYDAIHFGCIPVVLSDELVWAFSEMTGGKVNPHLFSIQFPQRVVQRSAVQLLSEGTAFQNNSFLEQSLPRSNITLLSLFKSVAEDENHESVESIHSNLRGLNTLLRVLLKIGREDIEALQRGLRNVADSYSYYSFNSSMNTIPTAIHTYPNGGAIEHISEGLSYRKRYGIESIRILCNKEKSLKHKYVGNYPCQVYK